MKVKKCNLLFVCVLVTLLFSTFFINNIFAETDFVNESDILINLVSKNNLQIIDNKDENINYINESLNETEVYAANEVDKTLENFIKSKNQTQKKYDEYNKLFQKRVNVMLMLTDTKLNGAFLRAKNVFEFFELRRIFDRLNDEHRQLVLNLSLKKKEIERNIEIIDKLKEKGLVKQDSSGSLIVTSSSVVDDVEKMKTTIELLEQTLKDVEDASNGNPQIIRAFLEENEIGEYGGTMTWPVPSSHRITSPFGERIHPITGVLHFHTGLDIGANYGAAIIAANDGKVIFSGWRGGYGNVVMLYHGGRIVTLYAHCSELLVEPDELVTKGQNIAKIGSTGSSTGNHLHFEINVGNPDTDEYGPVNPHDYVS